MIAANEAVATYLFRTETPSLYRVHELPSGEKLEDFKEIIAAFGYELKVGKPKEAGKQFQRLLKSWQGKPEAEVLNMSLLRSMKIAVYSARNLGHFGLGSTCYTHFTSPIRRYPDLIVHRMLTERLEKGPIAGERRSQLASRMVEWGEQLSLLERRAEDAERQAVAAKQVEFLESKIGQIFEGHISTVMNFGFFVELHAHFVEGLVQARDLTDDYYVFHDQKRFLRGVNKGREFHTGQVLKVKIAQIDTEKMRVIFTLDEPENKSEIKTPLNQPRVNPPRGMKRHQRPHRSRRRR
jgi:ribonuclease R